MSGERSIPSRRTLLNRLCFVTACCALGCATPPQSAPTELSADEPKVERGIEDALAQGGEHDVLVLLAQDAAAPSPGDPLAQDVQTLAPGAFEHDAGSAALTGGTDAQVSEVQTRELLYAAAAKRLLAAFTPEQLELRTQYQHIPMLLLRLRSPEALQALSEREDVARVFEDRINQTFLAQSLPLIHQPTAAAAGKTGAGTAVAVLDTGCDYTRSAFGSCAQPGATGCSVAYAVDIASDDGQRDDIGHGTNVAGIVLGVAPATKILALDVFNGGGATSSDILRAVDWVIQNRATYNIVAMNLSLGSGSFSAVCGNDVFAVGLANARAAGIIPVIASGNDGTTSAIASPACVPAAVSVGAVYDANVGGLAFGGCSDPSTSADKVTCFSNSASFLSVLAPGALITAAGSTQAGTSQAAPHVAGALAVLRAARPSESLDAVIARVTGSGPNITDPRNGIAKHRLDLQAALDAASSDSTPPDGSLRIDSGNGFSRSTSVTLSLSASDDSGVPQMCISNGASCTSWIAYASTKSWALSSGDGPKTVRAWIKDGAGNVTALSASTVVDSVLPKDGSVSATPGDGSVALSWSGFSDASSGLGGYQVVFAEATAPASCSAGTSAYRGSESSFTHSGLNNGTLYGYRVCAFDQAGNMSVGKAISARPAPEFDPPSGSVVINGDAAITRSPSLTLTLAASDASDVTGMCLSATTSCSAWLTYATTKTFTLPAGDGTRSVYAWFRDKWGNTSASPVSDSIVLDTAVPSDGSVTAVPGDRNVALSWTGFADTGSGIASYKVLGAATTAPSSCSSGTLLYQGSESSFSHTDLTNGTTYGYRVCALDQIGNVSAGRTAVARPLPEFDAPVGSAAINAGAVATNSVNVSVTLAATDASTVSHVCLSATTTCSTWQTFAVTRSFSFTAGDGMRTVYVWFRDQWGNATTTPVSDSIVLDTVLPKDGNATAVASDASVALAWSGFSDAGSGLAGYQLRFAPTTAPASCTAGSVLYAGSETSFSHTGLTNGTTYGYRVCALDQAGNISVGKVVNARPIPETDAPVGTIVINGDAQYANSLALTVSLSASDAGTVSSVCLSSTTTCTSWLPYATSKAFSLTAGDGNRSVYAWFRDNWGNTSRTPVSDSIVIDSVRPVDGNAAAVPGNGSVAVSWSGFSDAGSGLGDYQVVFAPSTAPASCTAGTLLYRGGDSSVTHSNVSNGSVYGYRVCAFDRAGNLSAGKALSARPAPEFDAPSGSLSINGDAAYTNALNLTLTLAASDASSVTDMCLSATTSCSSWVPFASSKVFALAAGDGSRSVYVWLRDQWGNTMTTPFSDSIVLDTVAPRDGTATAVGGDGNVTLAWSGFSDARSGLAGYQVVFAQTSAPASCSAGTVVYRGTDTGFSHTGLTNGTTYGYRVCALDNAGNLSPGKALSARAAPEYDAPVGTVSINDGAAYTKLGTVTLTLAASDASAVTQMCLSTTSSCSAWIPFANSKSFALATGDGTRSVYAWFRDAWGNTSAAPVSDSIVLDSLAPVMGTLNAAARTAAVALTWPAATDAVSGVDSYTLVWALSSTPPASCATGTQAYSGSALAYTHDGLSAGTYSYRLCAVDRGGNMAVGATRSIVVR